MLYWARQTRMIRKVRHESQSSDRRFGRRFEVGEAFGVFVLCYCFSTNIQQSQVGKVSTSTKLMGSTSDDKKGLVRQ